jgi:hypothetical protein
MRAFLVIGITLLPALTFANPTTITFPNMPQQVSVKGGATVKFNFPQYSLSNLSPSPFAVYAGIPLYTSRLQYQVDGGAVKSVVIGHPHIDAMSTVDGYIMNPKVAIKVPKSAKNVKYWFVGSADQSGTGPVDQDGAKYYSSYGANFDIQVKK